MKYSRQGHYVSVDITFPFFFFTQNKNSTLSWARRRGIYSNREAQIVGAIFNELLELNQFEQQMYMCMTGNKR